MDDVSEHERSGENAVSDVLTTVANLSLFRSNAFRVVELPTDASARDVMRQADRLKMMGKLGGVHQPGPDAVLRIEPVPDGDALRAASQRLTDPLRRLVDEIFWFSPIRTGSTKIDKALEALAKGDPQASTEVWSEQRKSKTEAGCLATHNLAVLSHVGALDLEHESAQGDLSAEKQERLASCWRDTYQLWKELIDGEGFWSFIDERIRELDDARLTTGVGRKIRSKLPVALLSVNAKLGMSAAERQQWGEAERQLGIIRASGFAENTIDEALQNVLTPVCEHIRAYCQDCKQQASEDADHANDVAERLLSHATPRLEILDRLLSANQPIRVSMHDEVALAALEALIGFGNKTKKWRAALDLLERVRSVAVSQSACGRINENLEIIRGNAEQNRVWGTCWFCGTEAAEENQSVKYNFHKVISRVNNIIRYRQMSISVPRCVRCKEALERAARFEEKLFGYALGGGAIGLFAGIGAYRIFDFVTGLGFLSFLLLVFCVVGYGYLATLLVHDNFGHEALPVGIKPSGSYSDFPPIKELFASGWSSGETPPTQG